MKFIISSLDSLNKTHVFLVFHRHELVSQRNPGNCISVTPVTWTDIIFSATVVVVIVVDMTDELLVDVLGLTVGGVLVLTTLSQLFMKNKNHP